MWRINEYMPPPPDEAPEGFDVLSSDEPLEASDFVQLAQTRTWSDPLPAKPYHVGRSIRQIGFEGISRAIRRRPRVKPTSKTRRTLRALGVRDPDAWGTSLAWMFVRHGPRLAIFNANGELDHELSGEILRIQRALRQLDEAMLGLRQRHAGKEPAFGHHPDPETDAEVEKDHLEGEAYNTLFVAANPRSLARGMKP